MSSSTVSAATGHAPPNDSAAAMAIDTHLAVLRIPMKAPCNRRPGRSRQPFSAEPGKIAARRGVRSGDGRNDVDKRVGVVLTGSRPTARMLAARPVSMPSQPPSRSARAPVETVDRLVHLFRGGIFDGS